MDSYRASSIFFVSHPFLSHLCYFSILFADPYAWILTAIFGCQVMSIYGCSIFNQNFNTWKILIFYPFSLDERKNIEGLCVNRCTWKRNNERNKFRRDEAQKTSCFYLQFFSRRCLLCSECIYSSCIINLPPFLFCCFSALLPMLPRPAAESWLC